MLALWTVLASGLVLLDAPGAVRAPVVLPYLLIVPGLVWVRLLGLRSWAVIVTLTVTLALAIETLIAAVLVYAGLWSASTGALAVATLTLLPMVKYRRPIPIEGR